MSEQVAKAWIRKAREEAIRRNDEGRRVVE
jgi:hypothetical protein